MSDPRPVVGPATELVYASLPELYRDADAAQDVGTSNYPLLRYLSLVLDQLTPLATYLDRFAYSSLDERDNTDPAWRRYGTGTYGDGTYGDAGTAALVDPWIAEAGWLPWLAQLVGVDPAGLTVSQQRAAIANPSTTWAHGTPRAIAAAARRVLTGGRYVDVRPHHQGDPYVIAITTKDDETIAAEEVLAAAEKERPAGYRLEHVYFDDLGAY